MRQPPQTSCPTDGIGQTLGSINQMGRVIGAPTLVATQLNTQIYPYFSMKADQVFLAGEYVLLRDKKTGQDMAVLDYMNEELAGWSQPPSSNKTTLLRASLEAAQASYDKLVATAQLAQSTLGKEGKIVKDAVVDKNKKDMKEAEKLAKLQMGIFIFPALNISTVCLYDSQFVVKRIFNKDQVFEKVPNYTEKLVLQVEHQNQLREVYQHKTIGFPTN